MKELTIKIKSGGEAFFLYSDGHPALGMGKVDLIRASNVLWHPQKQRWVICMKNGVHLGDSNGYVSRAEAIAAEVEHLSKMLADGMDPWEEGFEFYDELMREGRLTPP